MHGLLFELVHAAATTSFMLIISNLTGIIIPDSVTSIGSEAFAFCESLMSIVIPNGITMIDNAVFHYCTSLTNIVIPDSVTEIKSDAFCYSGLTSIMIPTNVSDIVSSAFTGCDDLREIKVSSDNINYSSLNGVLFNKNRTTLIKYPGGKFGSWY